MGLLFAFAWGPLAEASAQEPEAAHGTRAYRGLAIGAATGGVLGGLAIGFLANGLCEYDCDRAFQEGLVIGLMGGGVFGGLTGLVVGAGIQAGPDQDRAGPEETLPEEDRHWYLGITLGPRWAGPSTMKGLGPSVGLRAFRPTTSRVQWGFEGAYLGGGSKSLQLLGSGRDDGTPFSISTKWRESLWALSVMATRILGSDNRGYLLASAGAYPTFESVTSVRSPEVADVDVPFRVSDRSYGAFPGLSLGGGGLFPLGEKVQLGGEGRLHLIAGAGDESILPIFSLSASLQYRRPPGS